MAEYLYNSMVSYLNQAGGLDHTATSLQLLDTTLFPTVCNYRITIDSEILLVTANAGGLLTVTRGQEGTTATAHANQSAVFIVMTAAGLSNALGAPGTFTPCAGRGYNSVGAALTAGSWNAVPLQASTILVGTMTNPSSGGNANTLLPGVSGTYEATFDYCCTGTLTQCQLGIWFNGGVQANAQCPQYTGGGFAGSITAQFNLTASQGVQGAAYCPSGTMAPTIDLTTLSLKRIA